MSRILITGMSGMVAPHLAELLLGMGHEVHGTVRQRSNLENLEDIKDDIILHYCELKDRGNVDSVLKNSRYDYIFHLAAQSDVKNSFDAPKYTLENNIFGTFNLLESVKENYRGSVVHIAGTSEEFGMVKPEECPLDEDSKMRPMSPYGISKVACEMMALQYHVSYGLRTIVTRAFNHSGRFRTECFSESTFAKQIVERKMGLTLSPIRVGNLETRRDYTHVKDMVRAYWLAASEGSAGEVYVIASGKSVRMKEVLGMLLGLTGIEEWTIETDSGRMRPSDVPLLEGNSSKFRKLTGWTPEFGMDDICKDLLEYWEKKTRRNLAIVKMGI